MPLGSVTVTPEGTGCWGGEEEEEVEEGGRNPRERETERQKWRPKEEAGATGSGFTLIRGPENVSCLCWCLPSFLPFFFLSNTSRFFFSFFLFKHSLCTLHRATGKTTELSKHSCEARFVVLKYDRKINK